MEYLRDPFGMAAVLVEQCFDVAKALADRFVVLDRGEAVMAGDRADIATNEPEPRRGLTV